MDTFFLPWPGVAYMPKLFNIYAVYPDPEMHNTESETQVWKSEQHDNAFPSASLPKIVLCFCSHLGHIHHLKLWLMQCSVDYMDTYSINARMHNNEHSKMQLELYDS